MDILPFNHLLIKKENKFYRDLTKSFHIDLVFNSMTNCFEKVHPDSDITSSDFVLNEQQFTNCLKKFYNLIDKI